MSEDREFDLLRRVRDGDEAALATLYDNWGEQVHSLVFHMLGDADDAEDVVEETFWQVWRTANRYRQSRGSVGTWLVMIARSRALDRLRIRKSRREQLNEGMADAVQELNNPTSFASPLDSTESAERRSFITSALDDLPAEQREVMELAFFYGFTQSEIAKRTDQPLGTVKTRVRLAMRKLRERLSFLRSEEA